MNRLKKLNLFHWLSLALILQLLLVRFMAQFPNWVEQQYGQTWYVFWSKFLRSFYGWIPFSIGDLFYILLILFIIWILFKAVKNKQFSLKGFIFKSLSLISILHLLFYLSWGLNYFQPSLMSKLEVKPQPYNLKTLQPFTERLIKKVNSLQLQLALHDSLPVHNPNAPKDILNKTIDGYQQLNSLNGFDLNITPASIKPSILSLPLSYMGFAGYLNPFTGEAQVNYLMPKYSLPMTCSHEMAHQLGIALESEANFIGFMAAANHPDIYFKYAAYIAALRYALNDVYRADKALYQSNLELLNPGVLKNFEESREFWNSYKNPTEPFFKLFYDNFLKMNQQKDGLESYSQMVNLLMAYDEKYGFISF